VFNPTRRGHNLHAVARGAHLAAAANAAVDAATPRRRGGATAQVAPSRRDAQVSARLLMHGVCLGRVDRQLA